MTHCASVVTFGSCGGACGVGESTGGGAFGMLGGGAFGNDGGGAFGPVDGIGVGTRIGCGNDGGVLLVLGVGAAAARTMGTPWEPLLRSS